MEEDAYIKDAFLEIFLNSKTTFYNTSPGQLLNACDFMETCFEKILHWLLSKDCLVKIATNKVLTNI